jgi:disintegrin and metalloproteinase domain-containing protein 10
MILKYQSILFIIGFLTIFIEFGYSLNKYIDGYETLNYRPILDRRKRSTATTSESVDDSSIEFRFRSHNRVFNLKLFPVNSESIFSDDHQLDINGEYINTNLIRPEEFLYEGFVKDDPGSHVYGSIMDGLFDGHIILSDGKTLTVEKISRYFSPDERPKNYHSVIYYDDKINHDKYRRVKREIYEHDDDSHDGCGLTKSLKRKMQEIQNAGEGPYGTPNYYSTFDDEPVSHLSPRHKDSIFGQFVSNKTKQQIRKKRSVFGIGTSLINGKNIHKVRTCSIYMQADHKLYEHVFHKEGNRDPVRTREEIVALFYNHIKAVNQIYEVTNFGGITGLNFVIQRTTIFTRESCNTKGPTDNPFCEENVDVSNFLNLNSQRNHSAFCLAYALTFRDFVGGTLGLAWVASPNYNTAGGICQVYQKYNEGSRGMVYRSLNTGIVTLVNYGNRVPARVSQLTLAHEIGHNFGSPHDYPAECQPGLPDGNFIMFASATSGDKINNARFSSCSITNISSVLFEVLSQPPVNPLTSALGAYGRKRNCFQERTSAFCGNQIKEPGEECDCGFSDKDCDLLRDKCCQPHEVKGRYNSVAACKRVPGAICSPSEGQCCNAESCSFYFAQDRRSCLSETECTFQQFCDGRGPECPEPRHKQNGIPCQDATKVCQSGACNGSICAEVGLKDCFLTEGKPAQLCHLACEKDGKCLSSFELPEFRGGKFNQTGREGKSGLLLHPGSPCNNYKGYCDILRKCRSVDSNGPLARLKNLLFNKETIQTVSQWVHEHWWACVLMGIGGLIFMAIFVKCCAVHTPSTNPNKAPAAHFTDTLRHPGTLLRRGRQHGRIPPNGPNLGNRPQGGAAIPLPQQQQRQNRHQRRAAASTAANSSSQPPPISSSRTPHNISAPPLISSPPPMTPPSAPIIEPPPPYSPTDPTANTSTGPVHVPPSLTGNARTLSPAALPGAPAPHPPSIATLPVIPGQGPKPGRRKQKPETSSKGGPSSNDKKLNKRSAK